MIWHVGLISSRYSFGSDKAWIKDSICSCDVCKSSFMLKKARTFFRCVGTSFWIDESFATTAVRYPGLSCGLMDGSFIPFFFQYLV